MPNVLAPSYLRIVLIADGACPGCRSSALTGYKVLNCTPFFFYFFIFSLVNVFLKPRVDSDFEMLLSACPSSGIRFVCVVLSGLNLYSRI